MWGIAREPRLAARRHVATVHDPEASARAMVAAWAELAECPPIGAVSLPRPPTSLTWDEFGGEIVVDAGAHLVIDPVACIDCGVSWKTQNSNSAENFAEKPASSALLITFLSRLRGHAGWGSPSCV